jgi:hypothetical protein
LVYGPEQILPYSIKAVGEHIELNLSIYFVKDTSYLVLYIHSAKSGKHEAVPVFDVWLFWLFSLFGTPKSVETIWASCLHEKL